MSGWALGAVDGAPATSVRADVLCAASWTSAEFDFALENAEVPFCDAGWLRAWACAFVPGHAWRGPLRAIRVQTRGRVSAFLLWAEQRAFGFSMPTLGGYYWPYRSFSLTRMEPDRTHGLCALAAALTDTPPGPVLRLGPVDSRDSAVTGLVASLRDRGWRCLSRSLGEVYRLDLPASSAQLSAVCEPSVLKNARYCRRRLEREASPVELERHVLGRTEADCLAVLAEVESKSWVARDGGDTKFVSDFHRRFWSALQQSPLGHSEVVFWVLRCRHEPVAFSAHVETDDCIYVIANSYDESWKTYSPGGVLSLALLSDACDRAKRFVDWGTGDSGYKTRWGAKPGSSLRDLLLFHPSVRGRAAYAVARRALRAWRGDDGI